jgi:hypothetical protein
MAAPSTQQQYALNTYLDNSEDNFTRLGSTAADGPSNPPASQNLAQFRTSEDQEPDVENAQLFAGKKVSDTVCENLAHLTYTSESFGHLVSEGKVISHS